MLTKEPKKPTLHWFGLLLSHAVRPFSRASSLATYATNGYYLLGITVATVTLILWLFGTSLPSRLPPGVRDSLTMLSEKAGLKAAPEIPFVTILMLLYVCGYFLKSARYRLGEKFADTLFSVADAGLRAVEWCVEHRWLSLVIVLVLALIIALGLFHILLATQQGDTFT